IVNEIFKGVADIYQRIVGGGTMKTETNEYEKTVQELLALIPENNHDEADRLYAKLLTIDREISEVLFEQRYQDTHVTIDNIKQWAIEKGLDKTDPHKQMLKVTEEIGEVSGAIAK